mgnify:FL=1
MKITKEEVVHVAQLSRLVLSEEETVGMQEELEKILMAMRMLPQDTDISNETSELCNIMREDTVEPSYDRKRLLTAAASHSDESVIVPKTVE